MQLRDLPGSRAFRSIAIGLACIAVVLSVFRAGLALGYRRATFAARWGEHYERNFGGPRRGMFSRGFWDRGAPNPHGTFGRILSIALPEITVAGRTAEQVVRLNDRTAIRRFHDTITPADLHVDDDIMVIGRPDGNGVIDATFVRILSVPPPSPHREPPRPEPSAAPPTHS